jgi:hypothetical protein
MHIMIRGQSYFEIIGIPEIMEIPLGLRHPTSPVRMDVLHLEFPGVRRALTK